MFLDWEIKVSTHNIRWDKDVNEYSRVMLPLHAFTKGRL